MQLSRFILISLFLLFSCKNDAQENKIDEIFVDKIFFSGDELNNYSFISSDNYNKEDSLSYSIYKKNNQDEYVLSIEKLISNDDKEKYKIIDIFRFKDYSKNTKIQLNEEKNTYNLLLINNGKTLKKWPFKQNRIQQQINTIWEGKYEGSFLRLKDESADPRAWGNITLEIKEKNATLKIESYVENIEKNLTVIAESATEIKLKEETNNKFLSINKKSNKISLKGNLMESIVGSKDIYELKIVKESH